MKKLYSAAMIVLIIALTFSLVACGGASDKADDGGISVETIQFSQDSVTLAADDIYIPQYTFSPENATNKSVVLSSSSNNVIKVEDGNLVAMACGSATITAKTKNNKIAQLNVTVSVPTSYSVQSSETFNLIYPSTYIPTVGSDSGVSLYMYNAAAGVGSNFNMTIEPKNRLYDNLTPALYKKYLEDTYSQQGYDAVVEVKPFEYTVIGGKSSMKIKSVTSLLGQSISQTQYIIRGGIYDYAIAFTPYEEDMSSIENMVIKHFYLK